MAEKSHKGSLPYGWSVHLSTKYPNKVYYFNFITGDTTWELPVLNPPRNATEEKEREVIDAFNKNGKSDSCKTFEVVSPDIREDNVEKAAIPPTAVVTPVVQKSKTEDSLVQASGKKVRFKRKCDSLSESYHEAEMSDKSPLQKRKHMSPLNKYSTEEASDDLLNRMQSSVEKMADDEMSNSIIQDSTSENIINDIEMRDVSVELFNDLAEKKETVFDTTACYYIVVDTNVLIGELDLVNELKDTPLDGCGPPHIFIPWIVIQELDNLKSQRMSKVSASASEAIRYLNSVLCKHPRFHGQSPAEAEAWAKTYSRNNDDKILECCIGLSNKMPAEKVILLTNDKNLVNKGRVCKINVHDFESMIKKVKPDTKFNCEEMKSGRKKKREKETEVQKESNKSQITYEERMLHSKRDKCKCEIHTIMSNARLRLKEVLHNFLSEEMLEAYGNIWVDFPIKINLLTGLLQGILTYWRTVFYEFLSEKDKRNFELLLEKASRPEGFLGDKDDCLKILSTVEDIFSQIKKRRPKLNVPVELIQEYRVACVSCFITYCETEGEFRSAEDKSVKEVLDDNWTAINKLCGVILDHYEIPHDFDYFGKGTKYSETEIHLLMVSVYPSVQKIKRLLCDIFNAVNKSQPVKKLTKELAAALLKFIPSLDLGYEQKKYPFFNASALEKWLTSPQNRQRIEIGTNQIKKFFSKLEEAFCIMVMPSKESPEHAI